MDLSVATLKALIVSLGYKEIQTLPANLFVVLVEKKDQQPKVIPALFRALTHFNPKVVAPNKSPFNPEDIQLEVSGLKVRSKLRKNKVVAKNMTFGRENEQNFVNGIRDYLKDYKRFNVEFQENGRTRFLIKDVVAANKTGKDTANRKKSDVELVTVNNRKIPISLKQVDAAYWESPDSYFGDKARNMLDYALAKGKVILESVNGVFRLNKSIALPATQEETRDIIFGSDIHRNGAIISQTWKQVHFKWENDFGVLVLDCEDIVLDLPDLREEDKVYFQIRNHVGKNSKYLYPGLFLVAAKKKVVKNDVMLPQEARRPSTAA